MNLHETVMVVLENDVKARSNDNYLILKVFERMGWSTDLKEIAKYGECKFETITRCRRKIQETNPMLRANKEVTRLRSKKQEIFKDLAKGV